MKKEEKKQKQVENKYNLKKEKNITEKKYAKINAMMLLTYYLANA